MINKNYVTFKCLEVRQPIGSFFIGAVPAADVLAIASADVRRIEGRDVEKIVGIQRELSTKRVAELKQYVTTVDATFPTSIILAVKKDDARFSRAQGELSIARRADAASIIDGQHRIAGLEDFAGEAFDLNVTVFVDMDIQDMAMTFATINLAQTKVNKSLVFDLFEFQKARSPQKTCHNIARLLNREPESPLHHRIKVLGQALPEEEFQFITQATFVESLMVYITKDPMGDRDLLRRNKKPQPAATEADSARLCLRALFLEERDAEIAKIVWNVFDAVAERWPEAWHSTERGNILNRTNGFRAVMRILGDLYREHAVGNRLPREVLAKRFKGVKLSSSDFSIERYKPGSSGESALVRDLRDGLDLNG